MRMTIEMQMDLVVCDSCWGVYGGVGGYMLCGYYFYFYFDFEMNSGFICGVYILCILCGYLDFELNSLFICDIYL